jgi:hypothetical protein
VRSGVSGPQPVASISHEADTLPGEDGMRKGTKHHRLGCEAEGDRLFQDRTRRGLARNAEGNEGRGQTMS